MHQVQICQLHASMRSPAISQVTVCKKRSSACKRARAAVYGRATDTLFHIAVAFEHDPFARKPCLYNVQEGYRYLVDISHDPWELHG